MQSLYPVSQNVNVAEVELAVPGGGHLAAEWIRPQGLENVPSVPVILYFPGGGFAYQTAAYSRGLVSDICSRANCVALNANYRKAPSFAMSLAMEDALFWYRYLLETERVWARNIIIAGEGFGGGVAMNVAALIEKDATLSKPAGVLLFSPTVDLSVTRQSSECLTEFTSRASFSKEGRVQAMSPVPRNESSSSPGGRVTPTAGRSSPFDETAAVWSGLPGYPPTLVVGGSDELNSKGWSVLRQSVGSVGGEVNVKTFPGVFQMTMNLMPTPESEEAIGLALEFIQAKLQR